MALSSEILHQSLCPSVTFDHCRNEKFLPRQYKQYQFTTDNLGEYIIIFIQKHIHKQKKQCSLWMVIFNMLKQYIAMSNVTLQTLTQAAA